MFRATLSVIVLLAAHNARASDTIGAPLRIGVDAGYHFTADDFDVIGERVDGSQPMAGPVVGLRFGWRATRVVQLEATARALFAPTRSAGDAILMSIHGDVVARPFHGVVQPFVAVGGGAFIGLSGPANGDVDGLAHAALGVEFGLSQLLALRVAGSLYATDAIDAPMSFNPIVSLGIDFRVWRERPQGPAYLETPDPPPPRPRASTMDPDKDGVEGADDACPAHAGVPAHAGCPDTDGDGIQDIEDRCPVDPGARSDGCPDADGDGVPDLHDGCPYDKGPATFFGCPHGEGP